MLVWLPALVLFGLSLLLPRFNEPEYLTALWPAFCALVLIVATRKAALGLDGGLIAGTLLLHAATAAYEGAANLLPALGAGEQLAALLSDRIAPRGCPSPSSRPVP